METKVECNDLAVCAHALQFSCGCDRSSRTYLEFCGELTESRILHVGFSALRVYALLDGEYLMTALVLLLNVAPFATNIVSNRVSCRH
ncbi:hypothetical protein BC629DRAFT_1451250 [Irpex lacteus]|nr:hypothetical protein BC629DRAFT_1451250 [Irpex lacteus]